MNCEKCNSPIEPGEEREHNGGMVCEDCYIDLLSPARACDPWASMTAKSASQLAGEGEVLTDSQQAILELLGAGPKSQKDLARKTGLSEAEVERDIATLHHLEKVGGRRVGDQLIYELWVREEEKEG